MAFALSTMQVTSTAFGNHQAIPAKHTGEGDDVSPALAWQGAPEGTKGYAVICHDPDAPLVKEGSYGFVHWVLYNLPGDVTSLDENTTRRTPISAADTMRLNVLCTLLSKITLPSARKGPGMAPMCITPSAPFSRRSVIFASERSQSSNSVERSSAAT